MNTYPWRPSYRTELCSRNRTPIPQLYITQVLRTWRIKNHHPELRKFRAVLSCATHSLSDDPVLSILLGGLHPFFHRVDTVVPVLVSGCFPFCSRAAPTFVGSFCSHLLYRPDLVCYISLLIPSCEGQESSWQTQLYYIYFYLFFSVHYPQLASGTEWLSKYDADS